MLEAYLPGLLLGFGLITPIGPQNVFVIGQGLTAGLSGAMWAVMSAGCCDTILIVIGAAGVSGLLSAAPTARIALLLAGSVFLSYLGIRQLRAEHGRLDEQPPTKYTAGQIISRTVSVSLLNPHAILDTVGVIGSAVTAQQANSRAVFAVGAISASWLWFLFLAISATRLGRYLHGRALLWFDRISGGIMIAFATAFLIEFCRTLAQ